jgi:hypothetical protein
MILRIKRAGDINYSVCDGMNSLSQTLDWAFGFGDVGQTYVYEKDGTYYESRLSFFPSLQALDLTLGHNAPPPDNLAAALGRPMAAQEARQCFGCHTTASNIAGRLEPSHLIPGVSCEACHGPGLRHALAMREGQQEFAAQTIFDPARLEPQEYLDFCGACHRTAADVAMADLKGRITVRFQPYRLEQSRCWGTDGDARLTCRACHDPHQPLVKETAAYDAQCLACHATSAASDVSEVPASVSAATIMHSPRTCPVAKKDCASCHMPKVDLPGAHAQFTDHRIRIVKPE